MQTASYIRPHTGASNCPAGGTIRPGDKVRIFDSFYAAYFWHEVSEVITGARPQIKVNAYSTFISTSLVNGHRKGARRNG
jgi:hypothetical protein